MTLISTVPSYSDTILSSKTIRKTLYAGLSTHFRNSRVLVLTPDQTRSLPLPFLFRTLVKFLSDVKKVDFMIAYGTHPPLSDSSLNKLFGITSDERTSTLKHIELLNHTWNKPASLTTIGIMEKDEIRDIAGDYWHSSLPNQVPIRINKAALEYDHIIILGPTFPHEVVGFSGGSKYLFPGISGEEMINATHWMGALAGVVKTIGIKDTPARTMIHAAADRLTTPVTLIGLTVEEHGISGIFIGDHISAWSAAADFSAQRHIRWHEKPFQSVLSCAPPMYDELWTAAKAMYKLEPVVEIGGELIIYAPHLDTVSHVFGKYIYEVGYHTIDYFLQNWDSFKHIPLGVLAHSTHLRGSGVLENGIEKPNVQVSLASKIPAEDCARLNLGYIDPNSIHLEEWKNREKEGILFVPKSGEILYRLADKH